MPPSLAMFEPLLPRQRAFIETTIADLGRRHLLASAEMAEFRALVSATLDRNEGELLRVFDRRADWETYLSTVITRVFFEFQNRVWGEWRPSIEALRLGPPAVLLEELMQRDGRSFEQAIVVMRRNHRVDLGPLRLSKLALALGLIGPPAPEKTVASSLTLPDLRLALPLHHALSTIAPEDRLILQLALIEHQPLTRIARLLGIEVRPLQWRLEEATQSLIKALRDRGVTDAEIDPLLNPVAGGQAAAVWHAARTRPSS